MPSFGNTTLVEDNSTNCEQYIAGGYYQMGAVNGTAVSMTMSYFCGSDRNVQCALYTAGKVFVASTEGKTITGGVNTGTFNFASSPSLTASTWYYLCFWTNTGGGFSACLWQTGTGNGAYEQSMGSDYSAGWPTPVTLGTTLDAAGKLTIYCTYTEAVSGKTGNFGLKLGMGTSRARTPHIPKKNNMIRRLR